MGTACCIPFFSNLLQKPKVYSTFNAHSLRQLSTGWDSKWTCQEGVWSVHCNFAFMIANFCNIYNVYVMWMVPSWQLWHLQVNVHKMQLVPSRLSGLFVKITFIFRHPGPLAFRPIFAMHTWCCHLVSDSQWGQWLANISHICTARCCSQPGYSIFLPTKCIWFTYPLMFGETSISRGGFPIRNWKQLWIWWIWQKPLLF